MFRLSHVPCSLLFPFIPFYYYYYYYSLKNITTYKRFEHVRPSGLNADCAAAIGDVNLMQSKRLKPAAALEGSGRI